jgi:small-conductance mechanosensitive channel
VSHLLAEIGLRLLKAAAAAFVGLVLYLVLVALGNPGGVELVLLCWLSGAAFILLVESGPL